MSLETRISKLENGIGVEDKPFRCFICSVDVGKQADGWRHGDDVYLPEPGESQDELLDRVETAIPEPGIHLMHPVYAGGQI